jgi:hypothetical protein
MAYNCAAARSIEGRQAGGQEVAQLPQYIVLLAFRCGAVATAADAWAADECVLYRNSFTLVYYKIYSLF